MRVTLAPTIPCEAFSEQSCRFQADRFATFRTPTLLLLGGDSPQDFRQMIEMLDAALPNGRIAVMPGQRHVAMDTAPELFLGGVIRFLSGQTAAAGASGTY